MTTTTTTAAMAETIEYTARPSELAVILNKDVDFNQLPRLSLTFSKDQDGEFLAISGKGKFIKLKIIPDDEFSIKIQKTHISAAGGLAGLRKLMLRALDPENGLFNMRIYSMLITALSFKSAKKEGKCEQS